MSAPFLIRPDTNQVCKLLVQWGRRQCHACAAPAGPMAGHRQAAASVHIPAGGEGGEHVGTTTDGAQTMTTRSRALRREARWPAPIGTRASIQAGGAY